jgi:hypothetical protein
MTNGSTEIERYQSAGSLRCLNRTGARMRSRKISTEARPSKKAGEEGYTIVWVDESGFYLLPHVVRTWAPRGETPVLRVKLTHDHLSAVPRDHA